MRTLHARRRPSDAGGEGEAATIAVVDYGAGNLVSIAEALAAVGASVVVAARPEALANADGLVLPGVGASGPAMRRLKRRGLLEPLVEWASSGRPFLGICLGLQLLFEGSDEDDAVSLGLLPGRTVRLDAAPSLPHIGWNQVRQRRPHPLLDGIADGSDFYFVHSYVAAPARADDVAAETEHGVPFPSVIARGSVTGVQFHPERSGVDGLHVLRNFAALAAASAGVADEQRGAATC